ncbi:MAG: hypothetical protein EON56_02665 [Alphaproteobacteria bacterium]|nr:MAG: hypothetical protein EON56_02665 [Alphaproteobacteria bacterium]
MKNDKDDGQRPGRRTPEQVKERGERMRAWLATQGEELHSTQIGNLRFTEVRKIGAPSVFDRSNIRVDQVQIP